MSIFTGSAVAIVTPFKKDGSVDYDKFRDVIEYQIAGGTDCIVVCGTTGESSTLSHEEHLDCIRFCAEVVNKRIPVVAGTGSNCTETAIYLSQEAEKYGVDGLLVVTPYYNKATQKGLIAHYTAVANSVTLPIIMYNVPSRTGTNIQPETAVYLAVEKGDAQRPFHAFLADDGLDYIFIDLLDDKRYCDNQVGFDLFESFHYDFWGGNFAKQSYVRANCRSRQKVESTSVSLSLIHI